MVEIKSQQQLVTNDPMGAPLQGQDTIIINAPIEQVWTLIADSTRLLDWGPPVVGVQVMGTTPEGVGSYRRVDAEFNGKKGHFVERRVEHLEGKRMRFVIEEETFGLAKIMRDTGSSLEIESVGSGKTRVIFSFYHRPKGVLGYILNRLVVLRQQRRNRLLALDSLKAYAESLN